MSKSGFNLAVISTSQAFPPTLSTPSSSGIPISIGISIIALLISLYAVWQSHLNNRIQQNNSLVQQNNLIIQKLELINSLNKDYHNIAKEFKEQKTKTPIDDLSEEYYVLYWNQRRQEFYMYISKLLNRKIYEEWVQAEKSRYDYGADILLKISKTEYKEGYEQAKKIFTHNKPSQSITKKYFDYIDDIFQNNSSDIVSVTLDKIDIEFQNNSDLY